MLIHPSVEMMPGRYFPLGATWDGRGSNFAVFSVPATSVSLCLFDDSGAESQHALSEVDSWVWHGYIPDVGPGQRYGYRVEGPWQLSAGLRCNPHKLLLDPYALAVDRQPDWGVGNEQEALFDYRWADRSLNDTDSAPRAPRSLVVDRSFDWAGDAPPGIPLSESVVYECHVKGMTMRHPSVAPAKRGTYAGLSSPEVLDYLLDLGVTAVELMPVQQFVQGNDLLNRGTRQYFGYWPIAFLAPHQEYSSSGTQGEQVIEFKSMVRELHQAGLEVILDVVFNHTAEAGVLGPTLSHRGLDNRSYYLTADGDPGTYVDLTGVGNTLNIWDPAALRLIMDALRYWVQDMHVDGFRFDLAASLAETDLHRSVSVFLDLVTQDPVLSPVKLIAEPWVPEYMLGRFPPMWSQWNDKFRNCVRDVWRSIPGLRQEFAWRVTGSPDIFCPADGEHPTASVNYAASHDGMTLHDIVSYTDDGEHAYGWGAEGDTGDPTVLALRRSAARNMLAMTLLSQGVPMLLHGDECGRTQGGNRNAYDRDDDTTYMQWSTMDLDLRAFCRRAIQLRRAHPVFRRQRFLLESGMSDETLEGIAWFAPDGHLMGEVGWSDGTPLQVSIFLDGQSISEVDEHGRPVSDDSFLVVVNAHWNVSGFVIPSVLGSKWRAELDSVTRQGDPADVGDIAAGSTVERAGRSFLVLRQT